jgi:hypothetical protein
MTSSSVASMLNLASSRAFSALKSAGGRAALGLTYTHHRRANAAPVGNHPACFTGGLTGEMEWLSTALPSPSVAFCP